MIVASSPHGYRDQARTEIRRTFSHSSSTQSQRSSPHLEPYLIANETTFWIDCWDALSFLRSERNCIRASNGSKNEELILLWRRREGQESGWREAVWREKEKAEGRFGQRRRLQNFSSFEQTWMKRDRARTILWAGLKEVLFGLRVIGEKREKSDSGSSAVVSSTVAVFSSKMMM
jgi:hypothetical protein